MHVYIYSNEIKYDINTLIKILLQTEVTMGITGLFSLVGPDMT